MKRKPFEDSEIRALLRLMRELFEHYERIKLEHSLGQHIQFPKIPTKLTESLAIWLINSGAVLTQHQRSLPAKFSGSGGDVVIPTSDSRLIRVEVKGTAESAFQHFGAKDLAADALLWIHYGSCFRQGQSLCAKVVVLEKPSRFISVPGRITLKKLESLAGGDLEVKNLDLSVFLMETPN